MKREIEKFRLVSKSHSNLKSLISKYKRSLHDVEKSLRILKEKETKKVDKNMGTSIANTNDHEDKDIAIKGTNLSWQEALVFSDLFFKRQIPENLIELLYFSKSNSKCD